MATALSIVPVHMALTIEAQPSSLSLSISLFTYLSHRRTDGPTRAAGEAARKKTRTVAASYLRPRRSVVRTPPSVTS